ncbi:cell division protein FtsA [Cardiobacteriaceae bacterium TAE3-ERU3]|nr:cell division protein FtsA [Cardiobacteriaceae bacterium TAE3-ERU3]
MKNRSVEVLVDVGSAAVRVAIAEIGGPAGIELLGVGCVRSQGMRRGFIVDMEKLRNSLEYAIDDAERSAELKINSAWYAIGGEILALNTDAHTAIRQRNVTEQDMALLRADAVRNASDSRYHLLHALRQHYMVDEHEGIEQPKGMIADRLGVRMHVIQAPITNVRNLERCSEGAGIGTDGFMFSGLAAAESVVTEDERQLGCCVADIGAGTIDFVAWIQGQPVYSGSLPIGGEHASSDLAQLLKTPRAYAETLKCSKGSLDTADDQGEVSVSSTGLQGQRQYKRKDVNEILRQRYSEMLSLLTKELHRGGCLRHMHAGLILTGGAARMRGLAQFATEQSNLSVRVARPAPIPGLAGRDDEYCFATVVGMAALLAEPEEDGAWETQPKQGIIDKLKSFFQRQ